MGVGYAGVTGAVVLQTQAYGVGCIVAWTLVQSLVLFVVRISSLSLSLSLVCVSISVALMIYKQRFV